ncbi:hypothetical protein Tco_1509271 [Tanacetum coccineum]
MKSINEGPFHMGTVSDVIAGGTEGAVQQGPVRARVLNDLSAEEKERYKADIRATNILLQGPIDGISSTDVSEEISSICSSNVQCAQLSSIQDMHHLVRYLLTKGFDAGRHVKRGRDTKIPQSSGPPVKVGDEAVHKELGDRMERAATTASSLEAEQDSGSINRTQSMTTINEPSP